MFVRRWSFRQSTTDAQSVILSERTLRSAVEGSVRLVQMLLCVFSVWGEMYALILEKLLSYKHRHHYVFQAYLKHWAANDQIWCWRNDKIFIANTLNVAQERDFYRIKDLNENEKKYIMLFLSKQSSEIRNIVRRQMELYERPLHWKEYAEILESLFNTYIYKNRLMPANVRTLFEEINTNTNIAVNDFVEDIYSGEEGALNEYLNDLIQGRTNFYYNPFSDKNTMFDNSKRAFLYYVAAQYFRTKAAEKRLSIGLLKAINDDKLVSFYKENGIDVNCLRPENMCYHISWFLRGQLADALYDKNSHLTILLNDTDLPFVTSDQPVINTFADYQNMENAVNDIMLYYPITPKVAITINDNNAIERIELNRNQVDEYNQLIVNASYESVFSNKHEVLENYLSKT